MRVLGLTGGIAAGKTAVLRLLQDSGAVVFSADEAARAIVGPGGPALKEIARAFGKGIVRGDGSLDRAALGSIVFREASLRDRLNKITHPPILRLLRSQIEAVSRDFPANTLVAVEAPLLFEAGLDGWFDHIVVVNARLATRLSRAEQRGMDVQVLQRRQMGQLPVSEKIRRADYVINNDGSREALLGAVHRLLSRLPVAPESSWSGRWM